MKKLVLTANYPFVTDHHVMKMLGYKSRGGFYAFRKRHKDFPEGQKRGESNNSGRIFSVLEIQKYFEEHGYKVTIQRGPEALDLKERKEYEELKRFKEVFDEEERLRKAINDNCMSGLTGAFNN